MAIKLQVIDIPDGRIKKHQVATPYLGGVAVYCGLLTALIFTFPFENQMFLFLVGTTLLLLVGLIDDLVILKPYQKLLGQIFAAICFLKAGFYLKEHVFYNIWNIPFSFLWILTVINAFNLIDIMDGLATITAIAATLSLLGIAWLLNAFIVMILLTAFLGGLCAFLWYNRPHASIYLGDAGSLFIGGFLATVPFLLNWGTYTFHGYLSPIIILGIPLLEVMSLIVIRFYKGIPFYQGSPDHFACYLQNKGWYKELILAYIFVLSLMLGIIASLFTWGIIPIPVLFCLGTIFLFMWLKMLI